MRKLDSEGLLLAEYQGKLFERSYDLSYSTPIFMRRFKYSELVKLLDENTTAFVSLNVKEGIDSIIEQFGESSYGKIKYSRAALFWIGYMYRYIAFTRDCSTRFVMNLFSYELLNNVYFAFSTQDPEWCIRSLLDIVNLDERWFDKNYRLKETLRKHNYYGDI
jgi:hypothetical protein